MKKFVRSVVSQALLASLIFGGITFASPASAAVVNAPTKPITSESVGMQMFMWNWISLANECTNWLGPSGVDWILVSPPQESVKGDAWWVHYQPVSYKLESSLGTRYEFSNMVNACNQAGVAVIVDAVINHMANSAGTGFDGSTFQKYDYPGIYSSSDFHSRLDSSDPNFCDHDITDYNNTFQNIHCELGSLPDLATEKPNVRATIQNYLNDLLSLGVTGFRIDAAKHVGIDDLTAIQSGLNLNTAGAKPFWLSESIGSKTVNAPFAANGQVFGWSWIDDLYSFFAPFSGSVGLAKSPAARYAPFDYRTTSFAQSNPGVFTTNGSDRTVTFVTNHDTERNGPSAITYNARFAYEEATIFTIVDRFGLPMGYSGYAFSDNSSGPNTDSQGYVLGARCGSYVNGPAATYVDGRFTCTERWPGIQGAIAWKAAVAGATQNSTKYVSSSRKHIKLLTYKRGSGNFIAFNGETPVSKLKVQTGLPRGTYCDFISSGKSQLKSAGVCRGTSVNVDSKGFAVISLADNRVLALSVSAKIR